MGFTLNDLDRLKVKVTNDPVTVICLWGYTPVGIIGVLVLVFCLRDLDFDPITPIYELA